MRVITREKLPGQRFWIKYPGEPRWFAAEYEIHNPHAVVISIFDAPYTSKTITAENAANEGYRWNDKAQDEGAHPFYVEEANDTELRKKLAAAGEKPVKVVLKSGTVYDCTRSFPSLISPVYVGQQDEDVTFEVIVNGKPRLIRWHEVADVIPAG
jgi:hypothetical protein